MTTATAEPVETGAHDDHDHPEWLAHHFETAEQQFDAGKLGIWLFLAQEVLFFTGLFVAYAVYRMNHPEVFIGASKYLNSTLGALNTIVLLASSLAIAWGVRCAQKNQQEMLLWMHIFTLACAGLFMGVKVVEYSYKFDEGLYWAGMYAPTHLVTGEGLHSQLGWVFIVTGLIGGLISFGGHLMYRLSSGGGAVLAAAGWGLMALVFGYGLAAALGATGLANTITTVFFAGLMFAMGWFFTLCFKGDRKAWGAVALGLGLCIVGMAGGIVVARGIQVGAGDHHADAGHGHDAHGGAHGDEAHDPHAAGATHDEGAHAEGDHAEEGHSEDGHGEEGHGEDGHGDGAHAEGHGEEDHAEEDHADEAPPAEPMAEAVAAADAADDGPVNQGNFFSIYFAMTGVHALHIFAGIVVIAWIIGRIARGDFSPEFYGPVEFVGLYWHLVDLVWIYLFPLLYLIN